MEEAEEIDLDKDPEELKKELAEKYELSEDQIASVMKPKEDSTWRSTKKLFSKMKRGVTGEKQKSEAEKMVVAIRKMKELEEKRKAKERE